MELYLMSIIGFDSSGLSHHGFYFYDPSQINRINDYGDDRKFIIHHGLRPILTPAKKFADAKKTISEKG